MTTPIREMIEILASLGGVFAERRGERFLHGTNFVSGDLRVQKAHLGEAVIYSAWHGNLGIHGTEPVYRLVVTPEFSQLHRNEPGVWEEELKKEAEKHSPALDSSELVAKLV